MRFVAPESKRYYLKNGHDWVEVKKELSVGEERRFRTRGLRSMSGMVGGNPADAAIDVDWAALAMARVEAYLVDWSEKRPLTPQAIGDLATDDFEEIDEIIQRHIDAMAQEKKATSGSETPTPA